MDVVVKALLVAKGYREGLAWELSQDDANELADLLESLASELQFMRDHEEGW